MIAAQTGGPADAPPLLLLAGQANSHRWWDGLREALKGFDFNRALDVLEQAGAIPKANARGERAKPETIGGRKVRTYQVRADALHGGGDDGA